MLWYDRSVMVRVDNEMLPIHRIGHVESILVQSIKNLGRNVRTDKPSMFLLN